MVRTMILHDQDVASLEIPCDDIPRTQTMPGYAVASSSPMKNRKPYSVSGFGAAAQHMHKMVQITSQHGSQMDGRNQTIISVPGNVPMTVPGPKVSLRKEVKGWVLMRTDSEHREKDVILIASKVEILVHTSCVGVPAQSVRWLRLRVQWA